jgi:hypothetical protein
MRYPHVHYTYSYTHTLSERLHPPLLQRLPLHPERPGRLDRARALHARGEAGEAARARRVSRGIDREERAMREDRLRILVRHCARVHRKLAVHRLQKGAPAAILVHRVARGGNLVGVVS